jgi:lipopolysaccharide/colanic/teichoic acid biosynthesis glycosyltransferase
LHEKMILVGPQPVEDAEVPTYGKLYREVTPGLSGLWQVSGRNNTTYEERVALDTYYVRNWSIWLDLVILVRTVEIFVLQAESLLRVSQKTLKVLIPAQLQFNLTYKLLSSVALSSGC